MKYAGCPYPLRFLDKLPHCGFGQGLVQQGWVFTSRTGGGRLVEDEACRLTCSQHEAQGG